MIRKINFLVILITFQLLSITSANAAFCSLRDPVSAMQILYGQNFKYRSLVTTVTEQDRSSVKQQLPFTLHKNELGKHTLYMIYTGNENIGLLQARSEWAKWGLIEIAWAINIDQSINSFYFQRCRSPMCNAIVEKSINDLIRNKTFKELATYISSDGKSLSSKGVEIFVVSPELALLAIRSALKTLAITKISWSKSIQNINNSSDKGSE